MSRMLIRPPAKNVHWERGHGSTTQLQNFGTTDQNRAPELVRGSSTTQFSLRTWWQDILQINPAHSQPNLIYYSGAQPFIRTGHVRRFTRTFMSASPRFFGRWWYVGILERQYTERARITGVTTRQGTTYKYPRFKVGPRAIQLTPGLNEGPPAAGTVPYVGR